MHWGSIASEQRGQFVMKNFYDLLAGRNAAKYGFSKRLFFDTCNELFGDLKIDISFEQSQPHLTQRGVDVRFADRAVSPQLFENILKFVGELGKHNRDCAFRVMKRGFSNSEAFGVNKSPLLETAAYFLGVAIGEVPLAAPSSIPKVQCVSTFFPWDFALIITLHDFSCNFCVT